MALRPTRRLALLGMLLSLGALSGALWLQQVEDWYPCALCIIQRYLYLLTALAFAVQFFSNDADNSTGRRLGGFVAALAALAGAGFALYHVWILAHPGQSCGVDPMQTRLNALPWVQWFPALFEVDGMCTDPYPPFLGLQLPAWSAVGFVVQLVLASFTLRTVRRPITGLM
ncbi:disulfide bond formation protein B [Limnobacter litoralis]|uniref:Disulfide bond formation protein B n=1 Tax=Limnobacter litoralis TaxID=481366 RepID=A0ABQ5YVS1_9BURK|nr:disulfide bond formation protein B [Limnobacter litoralis]GLR26884.1 disulfide bond formation protein B 1 [Limnobacter litoralis]